MIKPLIALGIVLLPVAAASAEEFAATNAYVTETKAWPITTKDGYWMVRFEGVSQVTKGPIETMAVECNGAGFWGAEGIVGNGICVHGSGEDTFILRWDADGPSRTWEILSGTGKYATLTGSGTATTKKLAGNRRISKLAGTVNLAD